MYMPFKTWGNVVRKRGDWEKFTNQSGKARMRQLILPGLRKELFLAAKAQRKLLETRQRFAPVREKSSSSGYFSCKHCQDANYLATGVAE